MLEIVISESEKNVLTYSNLFKKNDIVSFSLLLTYGKIKNIEQSEYKRVLVVELNPKCIFNELINYNWKSCIPIRPSRALGSLSGCHVRT